MPSKKKTVTETTATKPAEGSAAPAKRRNSSSTKSTAATHKAPARKTAARRSVPTAQEPPSPVFDETLHKAEIAHEAYMLWLKRGASHGQAHQDWLRAVEIVRARRQAG
ncbi:MAG: DUF2934 domain-containing protein [Acidobacteria bacterium]|nr:DUF2934 domain-containing protein [Acidobacteriota bacterium]